MTEGKTYKWVLERKDSFARIGEKEFYLSGGVLADKPWHLVNSVVRNGVVRCGATIGLSFQAGDAVTGATFRWGVDFEGQNANGSPTLEIEVGNITFIAAQLSPRMRVLLFETVEAMIEELRKVREVHQGYADKTNGLMRLLRTELATSSAAIAAEVK